MKESNNNLYQVVNYFCRLNTGNVLSQKKRLEFKMIHKIILITISFITTFSYNGSSTQLWSVAQSANGQEKNTNYVRSKRNQKPILVIENLGDWRTERNLVPYSVPVIIKDSFGDSEIMVFDTNYKHSPQSRLSIDTQWTPDFVNVYANLQVNSQCGLFGCAVEGEKQEKRIGSRLEILVDGRSYVLYGSNGQFLINDNVSEALFKSSDKEAMIRITLDENTSINSAIGVGTVKSWKTVYNPRKTEKKEDILISPTTQNFDKKDIETIVSQSIPGIVGIRSKSGNGTGFIIGKEGYILTNRHVVLKDKSPNISFFDGQQKTGEVILVDKKRDIALIKVTITENSYPALPMCITQKRPVGAEVIVIGNPGGVTGIKLTNSVSRGIISGFRSTEEQEMIQTDASVNPGNSGGPMINKTGHVIGIVNSKVLGYGIDGIGFAIPLFEVIPSLGIKFTPSKNPVVDDCGITIN